MILSLLPVLPPDLRPVIANPRGYITGDINTHYQNVIYRNNNIETLLDTFWIPRKFYNIKQTSFLPRINILNKSIITRLSYQTISRMPTLGLVNPQLNWKKELDINSNHRFDSDKYGENPFYRILQSKATRFPIQHHLAPVIGNIFLWGSPHHWAGPIKNKYDFFKPTEHKSTLNISSKYIHTQILNDSKPLQEMQYSLQKAVDALIDNSQKLQSNVLLRKGRPLKSLSDNLKGKEGRFRQHLLGKRVDYSGRSVIIVGPNLKLYECGIPLIMALRLFQPFLILYLINRFKIASLLATQLIQRKHPIVINILKKFIETWPVLLNRAPTLHRMNIQSFKIRLIQGKAILLHPLVCSSYNADFDGDQMGIHVPITQQARAEAWKLLWSINNSISLASRQPLFLPSQDMVIGNYYLTKDPNLKFEPGEVGGVDFLPHISFRNIEEAYQYYLNTAYRFHINTPVWFRFWNTFETSEREKPIELFIDKQGYSIYISKYYEIKLKRNRLVRVLPVELIQNKTLGRRGEKRSLKRLPKNKFAKGNFSLNPICTVQIIRSTFGRVEFYLHTLQIE